MKTQGITGAVERLYEKFPYPHYPLLAKPRWQEGYLASSYFAEAIKSTGIDQFQNPLKNTKKHCKILLAGSGEMLPVVVRHWEPWKNHLSCVDLSRHSLRRAKFRLGLFGISTKFLHTDLAVWLHDDVLPNKVFFDHIDLYGVLHHLTDPGDTLKLLAKSLSPGGTMRIMVYNTPARAWIHQIQAIFRSLKLSPYQASDREFAKRFITSLSEISPALKKNMASMRQILSNDSRFVDTFLHPREAKIGISRWFQLISEAQLMPYALFDRYAELDDLENPLWKVPGEKELVSRADDGRFENNLELFIKRKDDSFRSDARGKTKALWWKSPPKVWFSYEETAKISKVLQWRLWHAFIRRDMVDPYLGGLTIKALQRLCRIGAILPQQISDRGISAMARFPMSKEILPPFNARSREETGNAVDSFLHAFLKERCQTIEPRLYEVLKERVLRIFE